MQRVTMLAILATLSLPHSMPLFASGPAKPNIVVIVADDLGWNAVGYHNEKFATPNLDRLVASGLELNRFYVAPMCSPTRAGLMTGRYPIRFGLARAVIPPYRDFGIPEDEITLAEALEKLGYQNRGAFGKWHLGHRRAKWHPLANGFTHFYGHYNGAIDYFELSREGVRDWHQNYEPSSDQGYATDLIADRAARWIADVASADSPYFCYVPFNAPHSPFQAPEAAIEKFSEMKPKGKGGKPSRRQVYAAMIWRMDRGIGRILEAIERSGESDNTIVWFFSDNGGVGKIRQNNAPLRGSKLTVYEGGIRVPACLRWPSQIRAGEVSNDYCGYVDVMPTLISAAGGHAFEVTGRDHDGIDLLPIFLGIGKRREWIDLVERPWFSYHGQAGQDQEHLAVTHKGWKLKVNGPRLQRVDQLTDGSRQVELFHLENDLLESKDLKDKHPEKVRALGALLIEHRNLQPESSVPPYRVGNQGFVPPKQWQLNPEEPDELVGHSAD